MKIQSYHLYPLLFLLMFSCNNQHTASKIEITDSEDELLKIPFVTSLDNTEKDFFLYLPRGYRDHPEKSWPVLMFLHGDGERGNSKEELGFVLKHGPLYEAWVHRKELPFIIISPQLPVFGRDTLGLSYLVNRNPDDFPDRLDQGVPDREPEAVMDLPMGGFVEPAIEEFQIPSRGWELVEEDLLTIVNKVLTDYNCDSSRFYLTGLSYGGFGTWHMISKHPDLFAAASPVVGWGHPDQMEPIAARNMPLWVFSGGRDPEIQKRFFTRGINRLEELGHTNLRYTIHEDMGHDVWKRVYAGDDLYNWLLEQQL